MIKTLVGSILNRKPIQAQQTIISKQLDNVIDRQSKATQRVIESVKALLQESAKLQSPIRDHKK